jgi:hypothetical protein
MPLPRAHQFLALLLILSGAISVPAQTRPSGDDEFGPVVRAYLGYLRNEQEVVDDRASRREITSNYYRRNSSRIRALRQIAIRLARESRNDYLPELEAVAADEFGHLFEKPRPASTLRVGEVINNTFRFLGSIRSTETFYVFARLDPYEQADLSEKSSASVKKAPSGVEVDPKTVNRTRRVLPNQF